MTADGRTSKNQEILYLKGIIAKEYSNRNKNALKEIKIACET